MAMTKWHKLVQAFDKGEVSLEGMQEYALSMPEEAWRYLQSVVRINGDDVKDLFDIIDSIPKFFIDRELIDMLGREDVRNSLEAMHKAGVGRLPYPAMLVEFEANMRDNIGKGRNFVLLSERTTDMMEGEEGYHPYRANLFRYIEMPEIKLRRTLLSPQTMYCKFDEQADAGDGRTGFGIHYLSIPAPYVAKHREELIEIINTAHARVCRTVSDGLMSAMLLLNTRGVKKELVVPNPRENRERKKYKKRPIPEYTMVRVGHVYDKQGKTHNVGSGKDRKPMRVHWRRGHTRMVWTGPKSGERKQKLVYIEPCLVNFEGEMPVTPVQKVTW